LDTNDIAKSGNVLRGMGNVLGGMGNVLGEMGILGEMGNVWRGMGNVSEEMSNVLGDAERNPADRDHASQQGWIKKRLFLSIALSLANSLSLSLSQTLSLSLSRSLATWSPAALHPPNVIATFSDFTRLMIADHARSSISKLPPPP
jgi:hypothetical protein